MVIDPVSAWSKSGNDLTAQSVADRLIDWSKAEGTTLVCTSLLDEMSGQAEGGSQLQISTLADTWIHLNYLVQAGERNRGLSIIKSRGTAHSNQVRELILSDAGVTLADTYTRGRRGADGHAALGKGTRRAGRAGGRRSRREAQARQARRRGGRARGAIEVAAGGARGEAGREGACWSAPRRVDKGELSRGRTQMKELRGADAANPGRK